jgi:hypothetical protein
LGGIGKVLQNKFGIAGPQVVQLKPREFLSKVFDYFDEHGELRYQVLRYEPTRYIQRRPDGDDWVYNMEGVEPLPYRLPDMLAKPDATVFVVEGEKCADALAKMGLDCDHIAWRCRQVARTAERILRGQARDRAARQRRTGRASCG